LIFDVIGFDADDTLWHNEVLYTDAKARFRRLLSKYRDPAWVERRLDEIEVGNIRFYGYGIKSFALSMIETAVDASDGRVAGPDIRAIIEIVKGMLTTDVALFEHAEETLAALAADFDLMLITKGDQSEQERKVRRTGLARYFRYIEIVGEKSKENYRAILDKYDIAPARFLMVGNSLRSDILPVLAIGGRAVYIPFDQTWFHEMTPAHEVQNAEYDELEHLGQLPTYVNRLCRS
jgi:putative hydrolase of the HAD superfamily